MDQKKIFQAFQQANSSLSRKFGGTGLGLALSRKLAIAMGGNVVLEQSTIDQGSIFVLTLPGLLSEGQSPYQMTSSVPSIHDDETKSEVRFKVLVVEDAIDNQILIKHYLKNANFSVEVANNGKEAIRMSGSSDFDLILMDIQMPILDGYEATKWLRKNDYKKPIIALSAHAMEAEKANALKSGFTDYMTKPISRLALLATLNKHRKTLVPYVNLETSFECSL